MRPALIIASTTAVTPLPAGSLCNSKRLMSATPLCLKFLRVTQRWFNHVMLLPKFLGLPLRLSLYSVVPPSTLHLSRFSAMIDRVHAAVPWLPLATHALVSSHRTGVNADLNTAQHSSAMCSSVVLIRHPSSKVCPITLSQ